ncbi:hypothetical protein ACJRO7_015713 [Eucalyptus globulus]|uniref:TIR domain-containing protein n=1 Tax=Eucalyptus globulus TaxID=34317 RepID=A0ABD3L4K7_EUCGL
MANSEAGSSSDAARASEGEYQVFLNFRGPDTRYGFTDFLYYGLVDVGVRVFRDEEELRVGEVIGGNLLRAINNSKIYIPIFSQTYASSKWCLRELAHIVENVSKSETQKSIFPIFLDVEPEDIKLKTPRYSGALLEHEKKFPVEVKVWRKALAEVDEIKGWNVKKDESQATIAKLVVARVLEKLKLKQRLVPEHLVGLDDRVKHLTELLDVNHRDARLIGIYGMGGIGKTTIAKVVFNELSSHFGKCSSFLENVQEKMSTEDGIVKLQKKLLSDIVDFRFAGGVQDVEEGMERIGAVLSSKKVLVVLDDVDNKEHIKKLIGNNSLHSGSRIIITTRNMTIMQVEGLEGEIVSYEMLKMDTGLALQLFCRHAFGRDFPSDDYHGLSNKIVSSTGGLPLAIKVIGALLNGKNKAFWEETLSRLRNVPEEEILKKLRISYDDLDEYQQQIFLDIACFFFNKKKTKAIYMWASCQFYPERGINVLINRCLIKILDNDKKDKVQALGIGIDEHDCSIEITNREFERLPNLRFLRLHDGTYAGDFTQCPSKLRWMSWQPPRYIRDAKYFAKYCSELRWISLLRWISCQPLFPAGYYDFRANNMYLDHLVVFKLGKNCFADDAKAWDLIKRAHNLKVLSLTSCHGITTIPDFSKCLGLERLTLNDCSNLKRIESFIGDLWLLIKLKIVDCRDLTDLPEDVGALVKLKHFSLQGCVKLRELPSSLGNLTSLIELDLSRTRISELPNSIEKLKSLRILRLTSIGKCFGSINNQSINVRQFPSGINALVNLEELDLSKQWRMIREIPIEIGELSSLRILNLESTNICGIPRTINMLHHLQTLNLLDCNSIKELPELPISLTCLLLRSASLRSVPNLSNLTNLVRLQLCDGSQYSKRTNLITGCNLRWIGRLSRLKHSELNLLNVPTPPELASLFHLEFLELDGLDIKPLVQLPSSYLRFRNLSNLQIYWCKVEDIPLYGLPQLEKIAVHNCKLFKRFSIHSELTKLRDVKVQDCPKLVKIQIVGLATSLEYLSVSHCESLRRIGGLPYLKNLVRLEIKWCKVLSRVEGLEELESLKSLMVLACPSLRRLIDASCTYISDDCRVCVMGCGHFIKDSGKNDYEKISLKCYIEEILLYKVRHLLHQCVGLSFNFTLQVKYAL